jgi:hypothetical protein
MSLTHMVTLEPYFTLVETLKCGSRRHRWVKRRSKEGLEEETGACLEVSEI